MSTPMTTRRRTGILLALVTACVSGVSVFVNSYGVAAFGNPTAFTTAKNLVAAAILVVAVAAGRSYGVRLTRPQGGRQWVALTAVGVIGGSVPFVLFFEGLARSTSPQAAFLHKTLVLWVALLAVVVLGERLQWGHWVAIGLLVVGSVGLAGGTPSALGAPELMILAATLLWAVEVVIAKRLLGSLSSWTVGVARMTLGSVVLLAWVAMRGNLSLLTSLTAEQVGWVLLTGALLATYVSTWFAALQRAQAIDVTAVLVLAAPLTAALSAAVDGVPLQVGWIVVLVAGGTLAAWLGWRGRPEVVPVRA
ncbi:DMT family transporter [Nocardioides taihuensis]|uniref:DMT family transporter n=1 Tax=Nocardioides taihuensis TaxID=1835606 RepID=A0ABW0BEA8_9ACTN